MRGSEPAGSLAAPLSSSAGSQAHGFLPVVLTLIILTCSCTNLKLPLENKSHAIEKFEGRVSTKPLHAFNCSKLHGMKLPLPTEVVDLSLDEGVGVRHAEGVGYLLFNGQCSAYSQEMQPVK